MYFYDDDTRGFIEDNDIKFIRMSFCDILGNMKNIAIMPGELTRAIEYGIPFYSADVLGKKPATLMLRPDTHSLSVLPWRPQTGRVVRFFCNLFNTDGTPYEGDLRRNLGKTVEKLKSMGCLCRVSTRCEFYLFKTDIDGNPTKIPFDNGGYLDIAPLDKCENARREICLSLEEMGLNPISSCHKSGPGQNEIDFASSDPLTAADNMMHYKAVVKTIAASLGLYASFMPKPLPEEIGSALKIYISITKDGKSLLSTDSEEGRAFAAGIKKYMPEFALFMNPTENSYLRLDSMKKEGTLHVMERIELPGCEPELEIRSADACCNPYLTLQLLLEAGIEGMKNGLVYDTNEEPCLPSSLENAVKNTSESRFVSENVPKICTENFLRKKSAEI
ncbi:MAG: glutamine synthetase family protein [Ruminococcus sp.]